MANNEILYVVSNAPGIIQKEDPSYEIVKGRSDLLCFFFPPLGQKQSRKDSHGKRFLREPQNASSP